MSVSDTYDAKNDVTTLIIVPYGNIDIPGKWDKTHIKSKYNQHFFRDSDRTMISVTKLNALSFSFYSTGMSVMDFTQEFHELMKESLEKDGYKTHKHVIGPEENYVVWSVRTLDVNIIFYKG